MADASSAPVTLQISPERTTIDEGHALRITFRLCNGQKVPLCVCTWPGLEVPFAWEEANGNQSAIGRGYPDTRQLGPEYFVYIDSGQCYVGEVVVDDLFSPPQGTVTLWGEFRSDQTGSQHGYHCWKGRVDSGVVQVVIRKAHTDAQ